LRTTRTSVYPTMTFTIINSELCNKIQMVNKVVNSKNVLPILDNIIFSVADGILTLKASDSENTLQTQLTPSESSGEASFAVNAKNITEAVKNIQQDMEVTFEYDESSASVKVSYFSGLFSLPADCADEFPVTPQLNDNPISFSITDNILLGNIGRTLFATAQDELRPVMNGIFFDLTADCLAVVASDGHHLIRNKVLTIMAEKVGETAKTGSFILPKRPAAVLKAILSKTGEQVTISFNERNIEIRTENFTLTSRLIEGRYPNYNSVIPLNNQNIMKVNRLDMLSALKRVSPFSNESSNLIRMHVENNVLQLDAQDYDFSKTAVEKVPCEYDGQPITIGFKGVSVMELLQNMNSLEVEAQMADPSRAALFLPVDQPEGEDILMLQMPMLIND